MGRRCRLMSWMGSWLQPSEATVLHLALSSELCWFVYVWPRVRMQTQRHGNEEVSGLFTSRNRLNIIDFGEEINQRWSVALCPWQLNLTPFVLLSRYAPPPTTPHSPWLIFSALLIRAHSPTTKESHAGRPPESTRRALWGAVHVVIRTTRSPDTVPDWLNYSWYTPFALRVCVCVFVYRLCEIPRHSDVSHFTENESCVCCYTSRQITASGKMLVNWQW